MSESRKQPGKLQERINFFLTIIVLAFLVFLPPILCGLLYLSRVPDVTFGEENGLSYTRVWMYRERRPLGIAYQRQSVVEMYSDTEACVETQLRFLLWGNSRLAEPNTSSRGMTLVNDRWQPNGLECR
jgi:hypothetical protein